MKKSTKNIIASAFVLGILGIVHKVDPAIQYWLFPPEYAPSTMFNIDNHKVSKKDLEERLKVKLMGEFDSSDLESMRGSLDELREKSPRLANTLEKIVVLPLGYETIYSGKSIGGGTIVLKNTDIGLIAHEAAHDYSFTLPEEFWDKWTKISFGSYKWNQFPVFAYIFKESLLKNNGSDFVPMNGLLTDYGSTNKYEDVAVYVEDIFTGSEALSRVSEGEKVKFAEKLGLLLEYGFITQTMYDDSIRKLSSRSKDTLERKLDECIRDVKVPEIKKVIGGGMILYESADKKCEISYHSGIHGYGWSIIPDINDNTVFVSIHNRSWYLDNNGVVIRLANVPGIETLSNFPTVEKKLESLGYFDSSNYMIHKVYFDEGETKESVAKKENVPVSKLSGPILETNPYGVESHPFYYYKYN